MRLHVVEERHGGEVELVRERAGLDAPRQVRDDGASPDHRAGHAEPRGAEARRARTDEGGHDLLEGGVLAAPVRLPADDLQRIPALHEERHARLRPPDVAREDHELLPAPHVAFAFREASRPLRLDEHDEDVDELPCFRRDDRGPEDALGLRVHEHLQDAGPLVHLDRPRDVTERHRRDLVGDALLPRLPLAQPHAGDLRVRERRVRIGAPAAAALRTSREEVEQDAVVVPRDVRELGLAGHVADGVHARRARPVPVVDLDEAARVEPDPGGLASEVVRVRPAIGAPAIHDDPLPRWLLPLDLARPGGELLFLVERGSDDCHEHGSEMLARRPSRTSGGADAPNRVSTSAKSSSEASASK